MQSPHRFPWRLFRRFLVAQVALTLVVVAVAGLASRRLFRSWFVSQASLQARATLQSLMPDLKADLAGWCAAHSTGNVAFAISDFEGKEQCSTLPPDRRSTWNSREPFSEQVISTPVGDFLSATLAIPDRKLLIRISFPLTQLREGLSYFDRSLPLVLLGLAAMFFGFSVWMGRKFMFPLARLLVKAREVLPQEGTSDGQLPSREFPAPLADESLSDEEESEWSDLETTLDRIRWNLRSQTEALGREREELGTLMGAIAHAVVAIDATGRPLFYNARFALSFGDRELAQGKRSLSDLFRAPEVLGAFRECLEKGQPQQANASLPIRKEPANLRYFQLSVSPLSREGRVYGALGVFYDVTELKRAEQIRIDFVANVSHELRTPLTSIKGFADTLRQDVAQGRMEDAPQFLEKIGRNVDRLMALVGDLLDLSSLDSGAEVQKTLISTRDISQKVLASVEPLRNAKGHSVELVCDVDHVFAQGSRVEQVLTNLVENAMKYMAAGGRITVRWDALKGEHGARGVNLRVSDTGPGIPLEHQPRLFERFYRVDKGRSREMGGTGLGLAIVKHIMQAHGGSVYVTSEPGKGAEFVCQFPEAPTQAKLPAAEMNA
jgi:two-component system phosphate regulon sensor histidine kinase PhoR